MYVKPLKLSAISRHAWYSYALACGIILADQLSKQWISANLIYGQPWVFTDFFNFTLWHNSGAAFSFLSDSGGWQRWFLSAIALLVSLVLIIWLGRLGERQRWEAVALALVLGGALGNLYDRLLLGYVVDFIVFHYRHYYFPAFNLADTAISVGAIMLLIDALWLKSHDKLKPMKSNDE